MSDQPETFRPCGHAALLTRRGVIAGAAAVGGACVLAACGSSTDASSGSGGSGGSGGSSGGGSGSGASGASGSGATQGVPASDVPVGGGVIQRDAEPPYVVTQPADGDYRAFSAICTHQGCPVSSVEGNEIICTCHNSRFDAASGEVLSGPAPAPLEELTVSDEGGTLVVS